MAIRLVFLILLAWLLAFGSSGSLKDRSAASEPPIEFSLKEFEAPEHLNSSLEETLDLFLGWYREPRAGVVVPQVFRLGELCADWQFRESSSFYRPPPLHA